MRKFIFVLIILFATAGIFAVSTEDIQNAAATLNVPYDVLAELVAEYNEGTPAESASSSVVDLDTLYDDFIANGDVAVVRRVRRIREMYGFRFADVVLAFPDYDGIELEVKILLDTLHSELPSLSKEENDRLFYAVLEDYADLPTKRERMKKMKEDPYYNALQVKYAYAVTCHKAQGGQWKRVFLDQGYIAEEMLSPDYFRWLYTAFTRATDLLYLVNWPEEQTEK